MLSIDSYDCISEREIREWGMKWVVVVEHVVSNAKTNHQIRRAPISHVIVLDYVSSA